MPIRMFMVVEGSLEVLKKPIFTMGDVYLIVDEEKKKIWIWLGKHCSVDEKGTAAVEARRIDDGDIFHGEAQIITIDQGDEPAELLAKLNGLKIIDQNLAKSMLKDVQTGEFADQANHVNALYRVSSEEYDGINAMKYLQVPFERESLDSEDCFVADLGVDVWVWQGNQSSVKEKVKAMQIARNFDADRAGDQRPKVFEEDDAAEFLGIFEGKLPTQDRTTVELTPDYNPTPSKQEESEGLSLKVSGPEAVESHHVEKPPVVEVSPKNKSILIQKGTGRLKCPKCGNINHNMIREVQDRSNIIHDYPIIYGKKYICGECGSQWRRSE